MKKLFITLILMIFGISYASAQNKKSKNVEKPLTQEQRMVQSNAKHKNRGNTDMAKKVQRAKKDDKKARKKNTKSRKTPKRK